jgi:catalase
MRSADNNWDFWTLVPEALHQATITHSDRGIPRSFRHMHLFGSHTFSMINAANERVWVNFHFRTQQGIQNLTDECRGSDHVLSKRHSNPQRICSNRVAEVGGRIAGSVMFYADASSEGFGLPKGS